MIAEDKEEADDNDTDERKRWLQTQIIFQGGNWGLL